MEVQDYAGALKAFARYLSEGGNAIPALRKKEVDLEVARLTALVARVRILVNREGAEITVDDISVGKSPIYELSIGAGRHKFTATLPPLAPSSRTVDIASGDDIEIALDLVEADVGKPLSVSAEPKAVLTPTQAANPRVVREPETRSRRPFVLSLVGTGALATATAVLGFLSLDAKYSLDRAAQQSGISAAEMDSSRGRVKTLTTVTDIVGSVAIASTIVSIVLYFTSTQPSTREPTKNTHGELYRRETVRHFR